MRVSWGESLLAFIFFGIPPRWFQRRCSVFRTQLPVCSQGKHCICYFFGISSLLIFFVVTFINSLIDLLYILIFHACYPSSFFLFLMHFEISSPLFLQVQERLETLLLNVFNYRNSVWNFSIQLHAHFHSNLLWIKYLLFCLSSFLSFFFLKNSFLFLRLALFFSRSILLLAHRGPSFQIQ